MENYKNKEWLFEQYITNRKSCDEIALTEKRDSKTIWSWVKKFKIPTRKRGAESSGGTFSKGHKKGIGRVHTEETKNKIREARIKDGHVPYLKNGVHWLKGTKELSPNWQGGLTPERQAYYSSEKWVQLVKAVWKRDNAICQKCGKHHNTEINRGNFHIHHIISFQKKEHRDKLENLVLLCKECHRWVHSNKNISKQFIKTQTT